MIASPNLFSMVPSSASLRWKLDVSDITREVVSNVPRRGKLTSGMGRLTADPVSAAVMYELRSDFRAPGIVDLLSSPEPVSWRLIISHRTIAYI